MWKEVEKVEKRGKKERWIVSFPSFESFTNL